MSSLRILFLGDVVGKSGRAAVTRHLPRLRQEWALDFVVVNGENAAGGFGHHRGDLRRVSGRRRRCRHRRQSLLGPARGPRFHRAPAAAAAPRKLPARHAGARRLSLRDRGRRRVLVVNVMGRVFMDPLDDPFAALEREIGACPLGLAATRRSSTCMPRPPARKWRPAISPMAAPRWSSAPTPMCPRPMRKSAGGTAYQTDAGMCGDYDSVIGMDKEEPLRRFLRKTRAPATSRPGAKPPCAAWRWRRGRTASRG